MEIKEMEIKEKGYSRWEGTLVHSGWHWLPIFLTGIRTVWKKKYSKLTFSFSAMPFAIFLMIIYATTKPELKMFTQMVRSLQGDAQIFNKFFTFGFLLFMMMILAIFSGADLISADLRYRALPLYFSRPLSKLDYLVGKFAIVLFYLLLFSLVPGVLLYLFKLIFTGSVSLQPRLLLGIFLYPLVASLFLASITLGFSILSPNTRLIRIVIIITFIFSDNIAQGLEVMLHSHYLFLLSIPRNLQQFGFLVFGAGTRWSYPPWLSLAFMAAVIALFFTLLYFKIRKVEARS